MNKAKTKAAQEITLSESVKEAIEEQQARVGRLRGLIDCVREASGSENDLEDLSGAIGGLGDFADEIHSALDVEEIMKRARYFQEEENFRAKQETRL